jgi:3-hydroxyisobutyrate dehydrogenase-like beta-hydroxyacid dehydrogenase
MMNRIAILETGSMESRIAQNLLNANYEVVVYNRTPDKAKSLIDRGAIFAPTPRKAAEQAGVVISIELVEKDFRYAIDTAREFKAATPLSTAIHQIYRQALDRGYGSDNITSIARFFI